MTIWVKILGGLLVLAALAGAVKWASDTIDKAHGYDAAVARADQAEREKVELAKSFADAHAADVDIGTELAGIRAEMGKGFSGFRDELATQSLIREVTPHVDPTTGKVEPCYERDPAIYRGLFNQAVTGAATP